MYSYVSPLSVPLLGPPAHPSSARGGVEDVVRCLQLSAVLMSLAKAKQRFKRSMLLLTTPLSKVIRAETGEVGAAHLCA